MAPVKHEHRTNSPPTLSRVCRQRLDPASGAPGTEDVTLADVYQEFSEEVSTREKITTFKSRRVEKSYAFGVAGVPVRSEYLEVRYPVRPQNKSPTLSTPMPKVAMRKLAKLCECHHSAKFPAFLSVH